jgi:transcription elongation factor Elf1
MTAGDTDAQPCPRCGSSDIEVKTKIDLAFGEEVLYRACRNCGNEYDHGLPSADQKRDDS